MNKKMYTQNKKKSHSSTNYSHNPPKPNKLYMLPLIFILSILPFIVRLYEYKSGLTSFSWFSANDDYIDFFLYYKQFFFMLICSVMLIMICLKAYFNKKSLRISSLFIPLAIYAFMALLSTIVSEYSSFGYKGMFEQFESIFVLLGYCLVVYYAFVFINTEEDIKFIFYYFIISILVFGILGTFQAIGHDIFSTNFGLQMLMSKEQFNNLEDVRFTFDKNRVYLTLYNPNYVGVYVALVAPIIICLTLTEKKLLTKVTYFVALIGLMVCLYGSQSKAGLVGIAISFVLLAIFMRRYLFRKAQILIPVVLLIVAIFSFVNNTDYNNLFDKFNDLFRLQKVEKSLTNIETVDDIIITYNGNKLIVDYTQDTSNSVIFSVTDDNNQVVAQSLDAATNSYIITDERFANFNITPVIYDELLCVQIQIDGKFWLFTNQIGDGTYYYINAYGRPDKIVQADSALFTGHETFATGRGYIWSRTLPLLKDYLFLGSGADTFAIAFPQQDYINLYNYGFSEQLLTKPHNMYLQMGVQTGVLSLIAFLVFYGMYFCSSIYLYRKGRFDNFYSQSGVAIFIGSVSYMITGISNDSCITVAPVFWVIIGIGVVANYKVGIIQKNEKVNNTKDSDIKVDQRKLIKASS